MIIEVETRCRFCGGRNTVCVDDLGYRLWKSGTLIQHAMPGLSVTQREQLISGTCQPCWDTIFSEEEVG